MTFEAAIDMISSGHCILFVGSGFSLGAQKAYSPDGKNQEEVRSAWDVANTLFKEAGYAGTGNGKLGDAAQYYLKKKSKAQLIDFLLREFQISTPSADQITVSSQNWKRIYTTNYDRIIEIASQSSRYPKICVPASTPMRETANKRGVCVHLNGSISNLTPDTLDNEFKLTNRSYNFDDMLSTEWFGQFKEDLYSANAVFFVGFSGAYDLDLKRVFEHTKELKTKSFFIISPKADELEIMNLEDFGTVLPIGVTEFATKISASTIKLGAHAAPAHPLRIFKSFGEISIKNVKPSIQLQNVLRLFTLGELNTNMLDFSLREPDTFKYAVYRDKIDNIKSEIYNGERLFVVQSGLGNGKSLFTESLAIELCRAGYHVYSFRNYNFDIDDELNEICAEKNAVIIVENYSDSINVLKNINRFRSKDTILILSERSARHEVAYSRLDFFNDEFLTVDVDTLSKREADSLIKIIDKYGFWGKYAAYSHDKKREHILKRCNGKLSTTIISLLNGSQFKDRYSGLFNTIKDKSEFYQIALYILFSEYFRFPLSFRQIENMGMHVINNPAFRTNECIRELVDFDNENISFKSSILALFFLKDLLPKKSISENVISLVRRLDQNINVDKKNIRKQIDAILTYRMLSKFLPNALIFSIYENVSDCVSCLDRPLFWLQFAIARTSDSDFEKAKLNFDTAYALAKQLPGYNTYQIDTHYAHYLLKKSIQTDLDEHENPFDIFKEAHNLLIHRSKADESRHYIYRVASDYQPYFERYNAEMSAHEIVEFRKCCNTIYEMAKNYLIRKDATNSDMVNKLIKSLEEVIRS